MKTRIIKRLLIAAPVLFIFSQANATIVSVLEVGLGGDAPVIIANDGFGEDALAFSDRTHQHNGAAFDTTTNLLSTTGTNIVGLPSYLVGGDYLRFANNARENGMYSATVTADVLTDWYLLVDNRLDGPAGNTSSSNTTDPVLGGTLQWILDGGWIRVDTGLSPAMQADYTGVDEGGNGVGAGIGLNQFYSVYTLTGPSTNVTVSNNGIGGSNMISLVGQEASVPAPATLVLMGLGLAGISYQRRKQVKTA